MKNVLILTSVFLFSLGNLFADDIDDDFSGGEEDVVIERFSNEDILIRLEKNAKIACHEDECTLFSTVTKSSGFSVNFSVGEGSANLGGGTTFFSGDAGNIGDSQKYWSAGVQYHSGTCRRKIKVPEALYLTTMRYIYSLIQEGGETTEEFTNAQVVMLNFYRTIAEKADGCQDSSIQ